MIEVKNLKKTYVTKGNVVTKALDDVTINFPEQGLVFLLGKSGSGKSTLLNVCGGLDNPDSGEIIIMGKSSTSFSGSDFDSYRNTFVGFIFQEYNILNEFNIEENLNLALELQGKKNNKKRVNELLELVDLKGFEKRKPNTLSGGQKQRVAIARALIKEPKIIMADEPTGALDSKTGKQVFDTLKKLSLDHLVIVVSHDREFAEIYGDRIIELKDGKILSDEIKTKVAAKSINDNISIIGDNTISIKNGSSLSENDKNVILDFLSNSNSNIIISNSNHDIKSFKNANRISDDDKKESFIKTDDTKIITKNYSSDDSKFIKSKMPLSKAARMGISSLKVKPFRLILTMLLTITSFLMLGVASTLMNYNNKEVINNSFNVSDYNSVLVNKEYKYTSTYYQNEEVKNSYDYTNQTLLTDNDLEEFKSKYGDNVLPIYALTYRYDSLSPHNVSTSSNTPSTLRQTNIVGFSTASDSSKYLSNIIYGEKPSEEFEVAIPKFYANLLLHSNVKNPKTNENYSLNDMTDLLDKTLSFNISGYSFDFTICGIYEGESIPSTYYNYDNVDTVSSWSASKIEKFVNYVSETSHKILLISNETYQSIITTSNLNPKKFINNYDYYKYFISSKSMNIEYNGNSINYYYGVNKLSNASLPITYLQDYNKDSDGVVVPLDCLYSLISNVDKDVIQALTYTNEFENMLIEAFDQIAEKYTSLIIESIINNLEDSTDFKTNYETYAYYDFLSSAYSYIYSTNYYEEKMSEIQSNQDYISALNYVNEDDHMSTYYEYISNYNTDKINYYSSLLYSYAQYINHEAYYINNYSNNNYFTNDELNQYQEIVINYINLLPTFEININVSEGDANFTLSRNVIGYYSCNEESITYGLYVNDYDYTQLVSSSYSITTTNFELEDSDTYYSSLYVPIDSSTNLFNNIEIVSSDSSLYTVNNSLYMLISTITSLINSLKTIFFYLGAALAAFSALLLFNFITVSISSKTHEIGVLRSIGARGKDVFKIFFSESLFMALLAFIIALIGAVSIVIYLNNYISEELTFPLHLLTFGPTSVLIMLSIALIVAIIGTFIPVTIISNKKPVDSLRSL